MTIVIICWFSSLDKTKDKAADRLRWRGSSESAEHGVRMQRRSRTTSSSRRPAGSPASSTRPSRASAAACSWPTASCPRRTRRGRLVTCPLHSGRLIPRPSQSACNRFCHQDGAMLVIQPGSSRTSLDCTCVQTQHAGSDRESFSRSQPLMLYMPGTEAASSAPADGVGRWRPQHRGRGADRVRTHGQPLLGLPDPGAPGMTRLH